MTRAPLVKIAAATYRYGDDWPRSPSGLSLRTLAALWAGLIWLQPPVVRARHAQQPHPNLLVPDSGLQVPKQSAVETDQMRNDVILVTLPPTLEWWLR